MVDADQVAALCYERFRQLPRRGKPSPGREWTLLAAVVRVSDSDGMEVVSMGTGTKCIGQTAMSPRGDVLNDSHAEVMARRGCIRYLIQDLRRAVSGGGSAVFRPSEQPGKFRLHPGVSFLFFTSHTPCGDASIIPMSGAPPQPCPPLSCRADLKRKAEDQSEAGSPKLARLEAAGGGAPSPDTHRTGAKCVPGGPADPLRPGGGYHQTGLLRVKPGRGEPTLSLSCSDKLARWGGAGFQGALLSHYLEGGLYFSAVVVGGGCPFSQDAMHRALVARCSHVSGLPPGFSLRPPALLQSSLEFPFSQSRTEQQAGGGRAASPPAEQVAISWCNVAERPLDVTANGYKQGVTKKSLGSPAARSLLCKLELFHSFLALVGATEPSALPPSLRATGLRSYWDYKQAAASYQQAWTELRRQAFPLWPRAHSSLLLFL